MSFLRADKVQELQGSLSKARVKKIQGMDYLEGWYVIDEANRIFGFGNWATEVLELTHIGSEKVTKGSKKGYRVAYRAVIRVRVFNEFGEYRSYEDTGYGDSVSYRGGELREHENAAKEAVTDALKRSWRHWGNKFGLTLYDDDKAGVASDEKVKAEKSASLVTDEQKKQIKSLRSGLPKKQVKALYKKHGAYNPDDFDVEGLIDALEEAQKNMEAE